MSEHLTFPDKLLIDDGDEAGPWAYYRGDVVTELRRRAEKAEAIVALADTERREWQRLNNMWDGGLRGPSYGSQASVAQEATDNLWKALEADDNE
jgi:hypothetical protein